MFPYTHGVIASSSAGTVAPSTDFIIRVKTDNAGTSASNQFTIPTNSLSGPYNYKIETVEHSLTGQTGNVTLTFSTAGTYDIAITGTFSSIYFNDGGDKSKLVDIVNWGNVGTTFFANSFHGCDQLPTLLTATDYPTTTLLTRVDGMLRSVSSLTNIDLSGSDLSGCNNYSSMLRDSTIHTITFNQNLIGNFSAFATNSSLTTINASGSHYNGITNGRSMFDGSNLSSIASNLDLSNATDLAFLFRNTNVNQVFDIQLRTAGTLPAYMFNNSAMSTANYTDTVVNMANYCFNNGGNPASQNFSFQNSMTFDTSRSGGANFATAGDARTYLISTLGWTITNDTVI